jgi:hypothetical protein
LILCCTIFHYCVLSPKRFNVPNFERRVNEFSREDPFPWSPFVISEEHFRLVQTVYKRHLWPPTPPLPRQKIKGKNRGAITDHYVTIDSLGWLSLEYFLRALFPIKHDPFKANIILGERENGQATLDWGSLLFRTRAHFFMLIAMDSLELGVSTRAHGKRREWNLQ